MSSKSSTHFLLLTIAIAVTITSTVDSASVDADCSSDLLTLAKLCMPYLGYPADPKIPPSNDCCDIVKKIDMKCACDHMTKDIEKIVCMEKVVYVAATCDRPLPKGSKCGSYEVPPKFN